MRLLIFPAILISTSALIVWLFGDQLAFPEDYAEVTNWLQGQGDIAWLVGIGVIMADALLPVPSTPAISSSEKIHSRLTPSRSAAWLERWIVMPSAIGSENGMPISTTSPTLATALSVLMNSPGSG